MDDKSLLPNEEQRAQMDYILNLPPEERERVKLFMTIHTREVLFGHIHDETGDIRTIRSEIQGIRDEGREVRDEVRAVHSAIYGIPGDDKKRGALATIDDFTATMNRINTWLDGACWVLKVLVPWALGIATGVAGLGKYLSWW